MRQFLYGQRFFQKEFGITCSEVGFTLQRTSVCRFTNVKVNIYVIRTLMLLYVGLLPLCGI